MVGLHLNFFTFDSSMKLNAMQASLYQKQIAIKPEMLTRSQSYETVIDVLSTLWK